MAEKYPRSFKRQLAVAGGLGAAGIVANVGSTTGWMHRSLTHKAYKLKPPLELVPRTIMWGTGTKPRVWATVHRKHHYFADEDGDPHSPVLQGRYGVVKLFYRNTPLYMHEAREVEKQGVYDADLQPDELDRKIYDHPKAGLAASFAGYVALNKLFGNPGYMAAVSWGVEKVGYILAGNAVNSVGHSGAKVREAIFKGKITPHPNGSYGADSRIIAFLTGGEGNQLFHHNHPREPYFGPNPMEKTLPARAARDLGGTIALGMVHIGMAEMNTEPPQAEAA